MRSGSFCNQVLTLVAYCAYNGAMSNTATAATHLSTEAICDVCGRYIQRCANGRWIAPGNQGSIAEWERGHTHTPNDVPFYRTTRAPMVIA